MAKAKRFKRPKDWNSLPDYLGFVLGATEIVGKGDVVTEDLEDH